MEITLSNHGILRWLKGCSCASHLHQDCWERMIGLWNQCEGEDEQNFFYLYVKRDLSYAYAKSPDGIRPFGAENFDRFLACYNPANRYKVAVNHDGKKGVVECYKWKGEYRLGQNGYVPEEWIVKVEHVPFQKCVNTVCEWRDKCVRAARWEDLPDDEVHVNQYTKVSGCEWFIADTETGVEEPEK